MMDITVVVPTIASRIQLLERALRSVEGQTLRAAAVIVEPDHDRRGAAVTRNRALEKVRTEYTAFLDDDDELYPQHLKLLARHAVLGNLDVAYPYFDADHDLINTFGLPFDPALLRKANYIPVTVLARTDKVRQAGGFQPHPDENGDPCEDWGLWLSMHDHGCRFGHLPKRTWRWHNDGRTTKGRPDRA